MIIKLLLASLISLAFADKESELRKVEDYLGPVNWTESFSRPSHFRYTWSSCSKIAPCDKYNLIVDGTLKNPDTAKFDTQIEGGKLINSAELTRQHWESVNGDFIRLDLNNIASYGFTIDVLSVEPVNFNLKINNVARNVSALKVITTGVNPMNAHLEITYIITNEITGYGSLLSRTEKQDKLVPSTKEQVLQSINY